MTIIWEDTLADFVAALEQDDITQLRQHAQGVFEWLQDQPDESQRDALFDLMLQHTDDDNRQTWTLNLALVGYVSRTHEQVDALAQRLFEVIKTHVQAATPFAAHVTTAYADYDPDETERTEQSIMAELMAEHPDAGHAWHCLSRAADNMTVLMSYERDFLRQYRDEGTLDALLAPIAPNHNLSRQLQMLMRVFDERTCLLLDTEQKRGFLLKGDGISDLPQLHTLLMDTLAETYGHDPLDERASALVQGTGPAFTGDWVQGIWSFWHPGALDEQGQLPTSLSDANKAHHMPTQGGIDQLPDAPDNLPEHPQTLILLGPSAHFESWTLQRQFMALRASLEIIRPLSDDEYAVALARVQQG